MNLALYNPYEDLIFDAHFCFLSGALTTESMSVFPEWVLEQFGFGDERIEVMDKMKTYRFSELRLPAAPEVIQKFEALDKTFRTAFDSGYEAVAALDEEIIFQWSGRIVYGLIYLELTYERNRLLREGKEFTLSPYLKRRFTLFHLMMQSLIAPVKFKGRKPWSIVVFPLKFSADIFTYRDDTVNLLFQMGVNGFGMIVCFQDNGALKDKMAGTLAKMQGYVLHPLQFEELYAHFHYLDYILQQKPEYRFEETDEALYVEAVEMKPKDGRPLFGHWDDNIFAQLLSNYWSVYGIEREDILQFQKPRLSYLENPYTTEFVDPESITLPY
ncbi:MAG: hypothetical protein GX163_04165 [Bacteroidetes bacterium]|jgi:hypothetical protein|nr:hypothetical protein [Bacteroidota bacterium]